MRKSNESSLKEVIDELIESYKLRDRLNEVRIRRAWELIMGNAIANRTTHISVKDSVLHLKISSAPLREELNYQKPRILELMNKELEGKFLKEVVIN